MQLARTLQDRLSVPAYKASVATAPAVLTLMNAQRKRMIVQSMLPARTLTDPILVHATQVIQETAQFV